MFCTNCGRENPDGSKFCTGCGAPVNQAPQQEWQAPQQNFQPEQAAGAWASASPRVKQKNRWLVPAVIAVVVVAVAALGALNFKAMSAFVTRAFSSPEKFYRSIDKASAAEISGSVAAAYDNLVLGNADIGNGSFTGGVSLEVGDAARDLIVDYAGTYLDRVNYGDDLSWLDNIALTFDTGGKDGLRGADLGLDLNGQTILTLSAVVDRDDEAVYIAIPELSNDYMELPLEDFRYMFGYDFPLSRMLDPENMEGLEAALKALPDDAQVEKLVKRYLECALDCVDNVEKGKGTLSAGGISAKYTTLKVTIDGETLADMVRAIGAEMRKDKELEKIIVDVAEAAGEDGAADYDAFLDSLDDMIDDADDIEDSLDDDIVMTLYVDNKNAVRGRIIEYDDFRFAFAMPSKGSDFGLEISIESGRDELRIAGAGKRGGSKVNGDFDVEFSDERYATIGLDQIELGKLKKGYLAGGITLTLSEEIWDAMYLPATVSSILEDFSFRFDFDTSRDKSVVALSVLDGRELFLTLTAENAAAADKKIAAVRDGIDPDDWAEELTVDKLEDILDRLKRAGVPSEYTDYIDSWLPFLI